MTIPMQPHFATPLTRTIYRYPDHEPYTLFSLDPSYTPTEDTINTIVDICNEPLIYNRLFKDMCQDQPYSKTNNIRFFNWAHEGWSKNAWFVFHVKDANGKTCACIDIKSNDLNHGEVGYWASASSSGIMTNALLELCTLAHEVGYQRLYLLIAPDNTKSLGVARRAEFTAIGEETHNNKHYLRFEKVLRQKV
jgi:RimJ/RimL family protein N-acetyltransferase